MSSELFRSFQAGVALRRKLQNTPALVSCTFIDKALTPGRNTLLAGN